MATATKRRSRAEMASLKYALAEIVETNQPVTCRQVFYLAVSSGLIDKTEAQYKNTVVPPPGGYAEGGTDPV